MFRYNLGMITVNNLNAFVKRLRNRGIDARPDAKHDSVKGVNVGLIIGGRFYSLTDLSKPENQPFVNSLNFEAIQTVL